jgi:catechol 2,3-dioxygenase-like lactoylglutathione lyase family enzyme
MHKGGACQPGRRPVHMDNVGVVVDGLAAAVAFFKELGLELEGEAQVQGRSMDRLIGLDGVLSSIAMMRTPDGHGRVELTKFRRPTADSVEPNNAPPNTLGIGRIMFAVEDIDDVVARLRAHGAELIGDLVQYENSYRLCYVRGPEGILVGLAEKIGWRFGEEHASFFMKLEYTASTSRSGSCDPVSYDTHAGSRVRRGSPSGPRVSRRAGTR